MNAHAQKGRRDVRVDSSAAYIVRARAVLNLLLLFTVSWPLGVVWYGLPTLWQDYPTAVRRQWLTLLRGKTGPYRGIVW